MTSKKEDKVILEPRQKFDYKASSKTFYDMIIIGSGVTGWATAMYGQRLGLTTLVIGENNGGTISLTGAVENYPGIVSLQGPRLAKLMENHAKDYDVKILEDKVDSIKMNKKGTKRNFKVQVGKKKFSSKTVVVATGTRIKKLDIKGEKEFDGKGISYCALCDGPLFKGKILGVVGGSDSAVKEAILLTEYGKKVYIVYRGEKVRPEMQNQKRLDELIKKKKIEIINNTNVAEIKGKGMINTLVFDKPYKGKKEFKIEGLFIYIGSTPVNEVVRGLRLRKNKKGEIKINRNSETNIKGLYAAGDITDSGWKQAITGIAEGVKASYYAYEYISQNKYTLNKR